MGTPAATMLTTAPKKSRKAKKVAPDVQEQKPKALTKKVPPTAASAEPAVERPKKRKRTEPDDLPQAEVERRARQRELRELALKVRARGQEYNPFKARRALENRELRPDAAKKRRKGSKPDGSKPDGSALSADVQVVIIPIYWNKREAEKAAVLAAANRAAGVLRRAGLTAQLDASDERMPGAKFRHWEERGVRVRVELGPRDASAGQCVLATHTGAPGEPAAKRVVAAGPALAAAARAALGLEPRDDMDGEALEQSPEDGARSGEAAGGGAHAAERKGDVRAAPPRKAHTQQAGHRNPAPGGDSPGAERKEEVEAVGNAGKKKKKGAKQQLASGDGAGGGTRSLQEAGGGAAKKAKAAKRLPASAGNPAAAPAGEAGGARAAPKQPAKAKRALTSGDDLGDEFLVEAQEEEGRGAGKKKRRPAGAEAPQAPALSRSPRKKAKVVQF